MDNRHINNNHNSSFSESHSEDKNQRPEDQQNHTKRNFRRECNGDRHYLKSNKDTYLKDVGMPRKEQPVVQAIQQALPMMSPFSTMNTTLTLPTANSHNVYNQPLAGGLESCSVTSFNPRCSYFQSPIQSHPQENLFSPVVKPIYHLKSCVLYPPDPNAPLPTTTIKERPMGCKTVSVGGCPEKITESIIREIFDICGTVQSINMSKNFCYVKFSNEFFVKNALYLSGYWIKIENKDDPPFTGRLHIEYAQVRDDLYDHEYKRSVLQQKDSHQEIDLVCYTESEASVVCEKLKNEDKFLEAANILIKWLEKGECTKRNANSFYSMIQLTQNYVGKLQIDKGKYENQLNEAKTTLKKQIEGIIRHLIEVEKIYKAASLQKCWDQFTKAQRKNIEAWKKQTKEWKDADLKEAINDREEEEMELSDNEDDNKTKIVDVKEIKKQQDEHTFKLKETLDSLKLQLEATKNEKIVLLTDHKKELENLKTEHSAIEEALQNSEKEKLNFSEKCSQQEIELKKLHMQRMTERQFQGDNKSAAENNVCLMDSSCKYLTENARLIGLISTFLHVHPFGANINYICSYINQIDSNIQSVDIENLLKRHPTIFKEDSTGIGASLEKKWHFIGFDM